MFGEPFRVKVSSHWELAFLRFVGMTPEYEVVMSRRHGD